MCRRLRLKFKNTSVLLVFGYSFVCSVAEHDMAGFVEKCIVRINSKGVNSDIPAVGIALQIAVIPAELYPMYAERCQHQPSIPSGYWYFWQRIAFSLRIGEDTAYRLKADNRRFFVGGVFFLPSMDRHDDLVCFAAGDYRAA